MIDSTIYTADTVDTVGENMSDCKAYPADTVDIYGNAWATVGENIRNGIFGEKVKVGYVHINKGNITSPDLSIAGASTNNFTILKIRCLLVFTESIEAGGVNISFTNSIISTTFTNSSDLTNVIATIKIIYKDAII